MRISDWSSDVCSSDLLASPSSTILASEKRSNKWPKAGSSRSGSGSAASAISADSDLFSAFGSSLCFPLDHTCARVKGTKRNPSTEESRVGKGYVMQCKYWWWPDQQKQIIKKNKHQQH